MKEENSTIIKQLIKKYITKSIIIAKNRDIIIQIKEIGLDINE